MKIRKSILAAATAATVSVSGVVAAPAFAAEPTTATATPTATATATETQEEETLGAKLKANSSDDNGNWDPNAIKAWISVFTAALGLIGAVITFAQKNFDFNFNFPQF